MCCATSSSAASWRRERVWSRWICVALSCARAALSGGDPDPHRRGLIEPAGNRGAQVRRAEAEEIIQTLSVIGTLEAMAGELAAARISEPELRRIDEAHHRMVAAFQANDQAAYYHCNQAIHRATWEAATTRFCCRSSSGSTHGFGHTVSRSITGWKAGENLSRTITASWSRCLIVTVGGSVRSSVCTFPPRPRCFARICH